MLWLCVYLPQLGLEVCQQDQQTLDKQTLEKQTLEQQTLEKPKRERPTVLLSDNRVTQRNRPAQQRGIHIGTSLAAAHSIAADLVHMQRSPDQESQRLSYLSQVLYGFSSHVSIDSTPGGYLDDPSNVHHSVVLEISASLRLFGGMKTLLQRVQQQLRALQHHACLQVAHTPLTALCAARWRHQLGNKAAQSTLPRVLPSDLAALTTMPLNCLALTSRQGESLHNMGLRNCGALLQLPGNELGQRFGKQLGLYLQRLTGAAPDPRPPIAPPQDFASGVHLLESCTSKTALLFPVKRLCDEFSHWLIAQQLGVCLLHWEFANQSDPPVILAVRTTRACQAKELLLRLTQLQLERCELPRDVLDIKLRSIELEPWQNHSDSLFPHLANEIAAHTGHAGGAAPLTELLDKLRARLGPDVCSGIGAQYNHQPERAWKIDPLQRLPRNATKKMSRAQRSHNTHSQNTHNPNKPGQNALPLPSGALGKHRPAWLLPQPAPVTRRSLNLLHGPERLQSGWWHDQRMRRDYYIAQTQHQQRDGSYSWVFCEGNQWYVHGYFG